MILIRRNGGQTGGEIWVFRQKFRGAKLLPEIEFIAARLPTLQIRCEKKVIPYLNRHTPV
ncbi:MAG: hypothetical protein DRR16_22765 [Candidatus Parabeggiatoa sp. nov. 3]|nr:MAG: hypothetical protein DRR16_22765 [Gammaproteobacteria bacterium]